MNRVIHALLNLFISTSYLDLFVALRASPREFLWEMSMVVPSFPGGVGVGGSVPGQMESP